MQRFEVDERLLLGFVSELVAYRRPCGALMGVFVADGALSSPGWLFYRRKENGKVLLWFGKDFGSEEVRIEAELLGAGEDEYAQDFPGDSGRAALGANVRE